MQVSGWEQNLLCSWSAGSTLGAELLVRRLIGWLLRTPSGEGERLVGSSEWPVASLQKGSVANKADRPLASYQSWRF